MNMYTYHNIICITNRKICNINFEKRINQICKKHPKSIILREKDMSEKDYLHLAKNIIKITNKNNTELILHNFINAAMELEIKKIHLPLQKAEKNKSQLKYFNTVGISVHSKEEAKKAMMLGASYITAGHIFETDCKKGLKGRGLDFLKDIKDISNIPVYAIGGINKNNIEKTLAAGADGVCIMSEFMKGNI